jgi:hypothetical protein
MGSATPEQQAKQGLWVTVIQIWLEMLIQAKAQLDACFSLEPAWSVGSLSNRELLLCLVVRLNM